MRYNFIKENIKRLSAHTSNTHIEGLYISDVRLWLGIYIKCSNTNETIINFEIFGINFIGDKISRNKYNQLDDAYKNYKIQLNILEKMKENEK